MASSHWTLETVQGEEEEIFIYEDNVVIATFSDRQGRFRSRRFQLTGYEAQHEFEMFLMDLHFFEHPKGVKNVS